MSIPIPRVRVLIVEDETIVAADLQATLEGLGYDAVGTAETGPAAIAEVERVRPDIVLMDIQLRGPTDGIAVAGEIHRRWQIPVVFVTANANGETIARAAAAGHHGYVLKPFRPSELNATLMMAMQRHRLLSELFAEHTWLKTTMASLSDGVIATDAQGCVRYVNPAAEQITGWNLNDALGKPIEDVYPLTTKEGMPVQRWQARKALETEAPVAKELFLLRNGSGKIIPVEDAATPIVTGAQVLGAASVFVDATERMRREREQELERDRLEEEVQATTEASGHTRAELRALSAHLISAQEDERRRIARELHDDLAQRTAAAQMQLEELAGFLRPDTGREALGAVRASLAELSNGLREISHRLHPSVISDLGLSTAIRQLVTQVRESGGDASFVERNVPSELSLDLGTALYRITQEGLRNAGKHAAGAPVRVSLVAHDSELHLTIEDAGPGFELSAARAKGGLGLVSMRERARLLGGSLLLRTRPGDGTFILVRVPVSGAGPGSATSAPSRSRV
jgi:PAS domain S-box-containing protein